MSLPTVIGYAAKGAGQALERFTYDSPKLNEHDIRVSITHCGICYSDIMGIDNTYDIVTFPFVPGHEIVGTVSDLGNQVTEFKEGDQVGIGWQGRSCMQCEYCLQGEEQLCVDIDNDVTWTPYGGFATSVVVDSRFAYSLPAAMSPENAAVLMCAGLSVYSPLRMYASGGQCKVGIIGVGGLGHLAIQFAHALGCEVTAFSSTPEKKDQAIIFGADHFIHMQDKASMKQVRYSQDLLLYTGHTDIDWLTLLYRLRPNGRLVMVGISESPVTFEPLEVVAHQWSITGSCLGNHKIMREMLRLAQEKRITPMVELLPMSQVNDAISKVRHNQARYRMVLVNDLDEVQSPRMPAR